MEAMADIMARIQKRLEAKAQTRITGKELCSKCGNERTIVEKYEAGQWTAWEYCKTCDDRRMGFETMIIDQNMRKRKAADKLALYSTMNADQQSATFANYNPADPTQEKALSAAKTLVNDIITGIEKPKSILFSGSFGIGKSHLAAACCNELAKYTKSAAFVSISQLKRKITSTFNNGSKVTADEIMDYLRNVDFLVIDDIGQHATSEFVDETLQDLVESRQGKANVYTTNLSGRELVDILNPRVFERIKKDTLPIKVEGKSQRKFSLEAEWDF